MQLQNVAKVIWRQKDIVTVLEELLADWTPGRATIHSRAASPEVFVRRAHFYFLFEEKDQLIKFILKHSAMIYLLQENSWRCLVTIRVNGREVTLISPPRRKGAKLTGEVVVEARIGEFDIRQLVGDDPELVSIIRP